VPAYLRDMFTTKTGELGTFVMVYPGVPLSDGRQSMAFASEVGRVELEDGREFFAGSTSIIAAEMLRLMQKEAPLMVGMVFIIMLIIVFNYFRSLKWSLLATIPLIVGLLWMLLVMEIVGMKLNFFNMVVLPAIIGIANDDGIHLASRYRDKGKGKIMSVLRSTGEHCVIGTLTTMVGFIGLTFSFHPGLRSIGFLALIGLTTTLLAALVFLPAMAQWMEDRGYVEEGAN
jgi:predicted RND superfamily exporter protein